jgi:hypothetical protein
MYMIYVAMKPDLWMHLLTIAGEFLIIPGIAIYLFLKIVRENNPDDFFVGKAIFFGFFLSVIISSSVSLFFSYIVQFRPDIITSFIDLKIAQFRGTNTFQKLTPKEVKENIQAIKDSYSVSGQFKYQLFLGAARGLFLGGIFALLLKAKTSRT